MVHLKLSSMIALAILCVAGGLAVGYGVRSARAPGPSEPPVVARMTTPPETGTRVRGGDPPPRLPAVKPAPTAAAPAASPERKKTKLQRAAAVIARALKSAAKQPPGTLRLTPEDGAEFMALAGDPEFLAMMEKAGDLDWVHGGEFMAAILEELIPDLSEDQKTRLHDAMARAQEGAQGSTPLERKLQEMKQGRAFFQDLNAILSERQRSSLEPLERMGVRSVPARILWESAPGGSVPGVLDLWSSTLVTLTDEDRVRLAATAGEYVARLHALQTDLEAVYGAGVMKSLSRPTSMRIVAGSAPGVSNPKEVPVSDPALTQKQFDAYSRLLQFENDERQILVALLPGQSEAIRNADAYVPLLDSGTGPGYLGISGADAEGGGVRLTGVVKDAPAAGVGLHPGDVILEIDGTPVADYSMLTSRIREAGQGSEVQVKIRRDGATFVQNIRLGVSR